MEDSVTVRFRVADVYRGKNLVVYYDDKQVKKQKKRILAPGEMEQVVLTRQSFQGLEPVREIRICLED